MDSSAAPASVTNSRTGDEPTEPEFLAHNDSLRSVDYATANNIENPRVLPVRGSSTLSNSHSETQAMRMLSKELDEQDRLFKIKLLSIAGGVESATTTATVASLPVQQQQTHGGINASDDTSSYSVTNNTTSRPPLEYSSIPPAIGQQDDGIDNVNDSQAVMGEEVPCFRAQEGVFLQTTAVDAQLAPDSSSNSDAGNPNSDYFNQPTPLSEQQQQQQDGTTRTEEGAIILEADVALVIETELDPDEAAAAAAVEHDDQLEGGPSSRQPKLAQAHQARLTDFLENRNLQLTLGALLCLVVVVAVAVGVSVTLNGSDTAAPSTLTLNAKGSRSNSPSQHSSPIMPQSPAPTISPVPSSTPSIATTEAPSLAPTETILLLSDLPDYTLQALRNSRSPQFRAYQWLEDVYINTSVLPEWRKQQLLALVTIYYSVDGADAWTSNQQQNFLDPLTSECSWGLNVCDDLGRITSLSLQCPKNDVLAEDTQVQLPPEIALLTSLQSLHINDCKNKMLVLSSFLPQQLGSLNATLTTLDLYNNNFDGIIRPDGPIPMLNRLTYLSLDSNVLDGSIPSELGMLTELQFLSLAWNSFTESIPSEIGLLSQLQTFRLYTNRLTGSVPTEIGNLSLLRILELQVNRLEGILPPGLCSTSMTALTDLRLDCRELGCPSDCTCTCGF